MSHCMMCGAIYSCRKTFESRTCGKDDPLSTAGACYTFGHNSRSTQSRSVKDLCNTLCYCGKLAVFLFKQDQRNLWSQARCKNLKIHSGSSFRSILIHFHRSQISDLRSQIRYQMFKSQDPPRHSIFLLQIFPRSKVTLRALASHRAKYFFNWFIAQKSYVYVVNFRYLIRFWQGTRR